MPSPTRSSARGATARAAASGGAAPGCSARCSRSRGSRGWPGRRPTALEGWRLSAWVGVSVLGFYTAMTAFQVPHAALGVELTHHPQSRNRVFAVKYVVQMLGLFGAFAMASASSDDPETGRAGARWLGLIGGAGSAVLVLLSLPLLPRERTDYQGRGGVSIVSALRDVARNPEARLLLFVFFIEALGLGGLTVLVPFVTQYVMHRPDLTEAMLARLRARGRGGRPALGVARAALREAEALARRDGDGRRRLRHAARPRRERLAADGGVVADRGHRPGVRQLDRPGAQGRRDRPRRAAHRRAQGGRLLRGVELREQARQRASSPARPASRSASPATWRTPSRPSS